MPAAALTLCTKEQVLRTSRQDVGPCEKGHGKTQTQAALSCVVRVRLSTHDLMVTCGHNDMYMR